MTGNRGSRMGWATMQMPFGMIPLTLTLSFAGAGTASFSRSGCTRACSTQMGSDPCLPYVAEISPSVFFG